MKTNSIIKKYRLIKALLYFFTVVLSSDVFSQSLNPFIIGTLNPRDSIVIYYDVTINNLCGCSQISNQGTVTGSNIITFNTDDPDTGPLADPTITLLNSFPLPVTLLNFEASGQNGRVLLNWKVTSQINVSHYEIERSDDGRNFVKIGEVAAINRQGDIDYSYADNFPFTDKNFYRLRSVDIDGKYKYSRVAIVNFLQKNRGITLTPVPVINNMINLQMHNVGKGDYEVSLYNSSGQLIWSKKIQYRGGISSQQLVIPQVSKGVYAISIRGENETFTKKIIIQ